MLTPGTLSSNFCCCCSRSCSCFLFLNTSGFGDHLVSRSKQMPTSLQSLSIVDLPGTCFVRSRLFLREWRRIPFTLSVGISSLLWYWVFLSRDQDFLYSLPFVCAGWCDRCVGEAGGGSSDVREVEQEVTEQNLNLHLSLRRLSGGLSPQGLYRGRPSGLMTVTTSVCTHSSTVSWHFSSPCFVERVGSVAVKCGGTSVLFARSVH